MLGRHLATLDIFYHHPQPRHAADRDDGPARHGCARRKGALRRHFRVLGDIAATRGQTLAQLALAWALRDPRMTSVIVGASSVAHLESSVAALDNLALGEDELTAIEKWATED